MQITLDYLARSLSMHGALEDGPKSATAADVAKSSRTVNDESSLLRKRSNSGTGGGSGRRKTKCPELKYNKFQAPINDGVRATDLNSSSANTMASSVRERHSASDRSSFASPLLDSDVKEIKRILRNYINRLNDRDTQGRIAKEWRMVARVLDRVFFLIYLAIIIVSLAVIFFQMTTVPSALKEDGSCKEEIRKNDTENT